jgi:hypothetical protein
MTSWRAIIHASPVTIKANAATEPHFSDIAALGYQAHPGCGCLP